MQDTGSQAHGPRWSKDWRRSIEKARQLLRSIPTDIQSILNALRTLFRYIWLSVKIAIFLISCIILYAVEYSDNGFIYLVFLFIASWLFVSFLEWAIERRTSAQISPVVQRYSLVVGFISVLASVMSYQLALHEQERNQLWIEIDRHLSRYAATVLELEKNKCIDYETTKKVIKEKIFAKFPDTNKLSLLFDEEKMGSRAPSSLANLLLYRPC